MINDALCCVKQLAEKFYEVFINIWTIRIYKGYIILLYNSFVRI